MSDYVYNKKLGEWIVETPVSVPITSLASIAQDRILGRISSGTGAVEELTAANVKTILDISGVTTSTISSISSDISTLFSTKLDSSAYVQHFKGVFTTLGALTTAFPTASAGDYAQVDPGTGTNLETYSYDLAEGWVKSNATGSGAANTDALPEGSTNLYFTENRVRGSLLTGLNTSLTGTLTSTDSIIIAFGKIQNKLSSLISDLTGKQDTLVSSTNIKTINGNSLLGSGDLTISGGSGITNFTESVDNTSVNSIIPVVTLTATNAATDVDAAFQPKGNGALVANPSSSTVGKRGLNAVDFQLKRTSSGKVAAGDNSGLFAGQNNNVTQDATNSIVVGGHNNACQHINSSISGGKDAYTKIMATQVFGGGGRIDTLGDSQINIVLLKGSTTNTTPKILTVDLAAPSSSPFNEIAMEPQTAMTIRGTVIAKQQNSTNASAWEIDIFATCGSSGAPVIKQNTVTAKTGNIGSQTLVVSSTTSSGVAVLRFTFTGTAVNMKIMANLQVAEVNHV